MADAAAAAAPPPNQPPPPPRNSTGDALINVRDRLFHTLFYRLTLGYARLCPHPLRRMLETLVLLKALLCFLMLIYVHMAFSRRPVHCLEHVKDAWPRDGILRVEIMRGAPGDYSVEQSYDKEHSLQQAKSRQQQDDITMFFNLFSTQG